MTLRDCPNTTRTHKSRAITVDSYFVLIGTRVSSFLLISMYGEVTGAREKQRGGGGGGSIFCIGHILGGTFVVHSCLLTSTLLL